MSHPRVLITGAHGQLGQSFAWLSNRVEQNDNIILLGRSEMDITRPDSIERALDLHRPDVLINTAAYTAVDKAESEPDAARLINGIAPGLLAQACAAHGIGLVHVSTDYVFDGLANKPYVEAALTGPVSIYGKSKLEGEQAVLTTLPSAIVLRTSWVFSQFGHNFLKTMLRLGKERRELSIVADQVGGPSYAPHIAQILLALARRITVKQTSPNTLPGTLTKDAASSSPLHPPSGIYHFAGQPDISWYGFAQEIFRQAALVGLLEQAPVLAPISTNQYPTPACRPAQSGLGQSRLNALIGEHNIERDWRAGIEQSLLFLKGQK